MNESGPGVRPQERWVIEQVEQIEGSQLTSGINDAISMGTVLIL